MTLVTASLRVLLGAKSALFNAVGGAICSERNIFQTVSKHVNVETMVNRRAKLSTRCMVIENI